MIRIRPFVFISVVFLTPSLRSELNPTSSQQETWANWDRRLDHAFEDITPKKIPGRPMGILVPGDPRVDLLPLGAIGYEALSRENLKTIVIVMPAPASYHLDGLAIP